jgi:hypothetical protein
MRRTIVLTALAFGCGLALASVTAHAYTKLRIWRSYGPPFQLGYVVGYLDAISLSKRKDQRALIAAGGRQDYERWTAMVNEFYEDPANAERPIPDAMLVVGRKFQEEIMKAYRERLMSSPVPTPAEPEAAANEPAPQ